MRTLIFLIGLLLVLATAGTVAQSKDEVKWYWPLIVPGIVPITVGQEEAIAKGICDDAAAILKTIPQLSPREEDWLKSEYERRLSAGLANGQMDQYEELNRTREGTLNSIRLRVENMQNVCRFRERSSPRSPESELSFWTGVIGELSDYKFDGEVKRLKDFGIDLTQPIASAPAWTWMRQDLLQGIIYGIIEPHVHAVPK